MKATKRKYLCHPLFLTRRYPAEQPRRHDSERPLLLEEPSSYHTSTTTMDFDRYLGSRAPFTEELSIAIFLYLASKTRCRLAASNLVVSNCDPLTSWLLIPARTILL